MRGTVLLACLLLLRGLPASPRWLLSFGWQLVDAIIEADKPRTFESEVACAWILNPKTHEVQK